VNKKDSRAKTWQYPFVCELEALPPDKLRELVRDCIRQHIDSWTWERAKEAEQAERETLEKMRDYFVQERNNLIWD
jgi:hypothetical protein